MTLFRSTGSLKKMRATRKNRFCAQLFLMALLFAVTIICNTHSAKAATLQVSADYDKYTTAKSVEITLSVNSSSEITLAKYTYKKVIKATHFTKYESNGTVIQKNKDGKYSFNATQNGYVTVCFVNAKGEENLLVLNLRNIDNTAPELTVSTAASGNLYRVSLKSTDDSQKGVTLRYVPGAYASPEDSVWSDATAYTNSADLYLSEGKYTFLATDEAGNSCIEMLRIGDDDAQEEELRAVWISYLDFKTTGYTEKAFRNHVKGMFEDAKDMNMNAVIVHVRPFGDAMYDSKYFPWSRYVSGKQGKDPGFDPLEIMVEEAHALDLEFHAWLNPFRITSSSTNVYDLSEDNPARKYRTDNKTTNDRYVLTYDGKLYYNPSVPAVQRLLVNGIKEIVKNYDVDGIHFDDYFYPSLGNNFTKNFDAPEYEDYKKKQIRKKQDYLSIADWRRNNINTLISTIYSEIKKIDEDVEFGISPGGFIDSLSSDKNHYVDYETWMGYDGYIDYICPQLYWSNDHSTYPFNEILLRWLNVPKNPDVKFYVGIGAHRAGSKSEGPAWYKDNNVLRNMIRFSREQENVSGFMIYSYSALIEKQNLDAIKNMLRQFKY